jgi:hypothetical protein
VAFGTPRIDAPAFQDPIVDRDGRMSSELFNWFQIQLIPAIEQAPRTSGGGGPAVSLSAQSAAIAPTSIPLGVVSTGMYRVTTYLRVTTPAGVSSSVTPVIGFTDQGVACTMTGTALTANAINLPLSQTFLVAVDGPGPITYAMTYASNPAAAMVYRLVITCERVQ